MWRNPRPAGEERPSLSGLGASPTRTPVQEPVPISGLGIFWVNPIGQDSALSLCSMQLELMGAFNKFCSESSRVSFGYFEPPGGFAAISGIYGA